MRKAGAAGSILVIAGNNGAGKSSIAGEALRGASGDYFNPDEATQLILASNPGLPLARANSIAWHDNLARLQQAIANGHGHAFETTLGGRTITRTLLNAATMGVRVRMFYIGLASVEQHIERVHQRVARGGHSIPEERIRARYDSSRKNLIRLLPHLDELLLFDNSEKTDPHEGQLPRPRRLLHLKQRSFRFAVQPYEVPQWAKPIFAAAIRDTRA